MHFEPTAEQLAIVEMAERLLQERWSIDVRRKALDEPPAAIPDDLWSTIVESGWLGVSVPESAGGSALDVLVGVMLVERAGRHLLPNTLVTALAAAFALSRCSEQVAGAHALARELIEGRKFVAVAMEGHSRSHASAGSGPGDAMADGPLSGGKGTISGSKFMVPDLNHADVLLVSCLVDGRRALVRIECDAPGLSWQPLDRMDGQSYFDLRLDRVPFGAGDLLQDDNGPSSLEERVRDYWTLLLSADLLGCTTQLLDRTVAYAMERIQFDRPIGSFQAVSHRLADVKVAEEIGRSLLYGASIAMQDRADSASPLVSAAKAWLGESAVEAGEAAVQLHGGIGYTWEMDVHLYLRQARCNAVQMGDGRTHRESVAKHVIDSHSVQQG